MKYITRQVQLINYYFVFLYFFKEATAEASKLIFTQNTSKDAVPLKDVPFGGFENKKNNI